MSVLHFDTKRGPCGHIGKVYALDGKGAPLYFYFGGPSECNLHEPVWGLVMAVISLDLKQKKSAAARDVPRACTLNPKS